MRLLFCRLREGKLEIHVVRQACVGGLQSDIVLIEYEGLFNHLPYAYEMQTEANIPSIHALVLRSNAQG